MKNKISTQLACTGVAAPQGPARSARKLQLPGGYWLETDSCGSLGGTRLGQGESYSSVTPGWSEAQCKAFADAMQPHPVRATQAGGLEADLVEDAMGDIAMALDKFSEYGRLSDAMDKLRKVEQSLRAPAPSAQALREAVFDALDVFVEDLDRECGFTAYEPTVRAVQAAKKLARKKWAELTPSTQQKENDRDL